jgi:hypothetical protein
MSQKFSFVIEIKNGKPVTSTFGRSDAQDAKDCFAKARDAGSEAYLFLQPTEDKRTKSTAQTLASTSSKPEAVVEEKKISEYMSKAKSAFKKKEDKADDLSV